MFVGCPIKPSYFYLKQLCVRVCVCGYSPQKLVWDMGMSQNGIAQKVIPLKYVLKSVQFILSTVFPILSSDNGFTMAYHLNHIMLGSSRPWSFHASSSRFTQKNVDIKQQLTNSVSGWSCFTSSCVFPV